MSNPSSEIELSGAAAAVFLKQTMNEIVQETSQIQSTLVTRRPLVDTFDKIELRFGSVPGNSLDPTRDPSLPYKYLAIAHALDGHADNYGSENVHIVTKSFHKAIATERILISLHGTEPIPLLKMARGVLIISNQTVGVFCEDSPCRPLLSVKRLSTDDVQFKLFLWPRTANDFNNQYCLVGTIENLIESDQLILEEGGSDSIVNHFRTRGGILQSPNVVFVPNLFRLQETLVTKERHELATSCWSRVIGTHHDSNDFRRDIITSLGMPKDERILYKNSALKHKMDTIDEIRDKVDSVEIYHDQYIKTVYLSEGHLVSEYQNDVPIANFDTGWGSAPAWVISLPEGNELKDVNSMELYVSNLKLGAAGSFTTVVPRRNNFVGFDPDTGAPLVQYNEGGVFAMFDPYAIIVCSISTDDSGNDKYAVKEVVFWFDRIRHTLEALGISCSLTSVPLG